MSEGCCCCAGTLEEHKDYFVRLDSLEYDDEDVLLKAVQQNYGICSARIDLFAGVLTIEYSPSKIALDDLRVMLASPNFILDMTAKQWAGNIIEKHGQTIRLISSASIILVSWIFFFVRGGEYGLWDPLYVVLNLAAVFIAGVPTVKGTIAALKNLQLNVTVLIFIAAASALAIGDWLEAATVLFISVIGEALERMSLNRSQREVFSVYMLGAKSALVKHEGKIVELPIHKVRKGQLLVIRQGMKIPVDGVVTSGRGQLNESAMTGESIYQTRTIGDRVFAGTILEAGSLEMEAVTVGSETAIAQIAKLVEKARREKTGSEKMVDRFCSHLIPAILGVALLVFLGNLLFGVSLDETIKRALTILIVACPCSLVLATPTAVNAGIARAANLGILFKDGGVMERMAGIKTLLMDKTGTLTYARPRVVEVKTFGGFSEKDVLESAAFVESNSTHPLARAISIYTKEKAITTEKADKFLEFEGGGAAAVKGNRHIKVGALWFMEDSREIPREVTDWLEESQAKGYTSVLVADMKDIQGGFTIADEIREDAAATITALKQTGIDSIIMVTGDNAKVASHVGNLLGVDEVVAECMPDGKLKRLHEEKAKGVPVAMIGDGINDSPALAAADVGISMAAVGSDAAVEAGDVSLMKNRFDGILQALVSSQLVLKTIKWNIFFAIAVNILAVGFAAIGHINMMTGAVLHQASALAVILNSMTLFFRKPVNVS